MHEVGVAIDQAGRNQAAFAILDFGTCSRNRREPAFRAGVDDLAIADRHRAVLDDAESGLPLSQRRKPGVAPDARLRLRCLPPSSHDFSVSIGMDYVYTYWDEMQASSQLA